ncbi:hypothetical protein B0H21DRAFT_705293, partial [Amylocystis lapponica]
MASSSGLDAVVWTRGCLADSCSSTRIHSQYANHLCCKHCHAAGGCHVKDHSRPPGAAAADVPPPPALVLPPIPPLAAAPVLAPAFLDPVLLDPALLDPILPVPALAVMPALAPPAPVPPVPHLPAPAPAPALAPPVPRLPAPAPPAPHFVSQMLPHVAERFIQEHSLYVWLADDLEPEFFEMQDGFDWPLFKLNAETIEDVGFTIPDPSRSFRLKYYKFFSGTWSTVELNHLIDITEHGNLVFLKDVNVKRPADFDQYCEDAYKTQTQHMRLGLPHQRVAVCSKTRTASSSQLAGGSRTQQKRPVVSHSSGSLAEDSSSEPALPRVASIKAPGVPAEPARKRERSHQIVDASKKSRRGSTPHSMSTKKEPADIDLTLDSPIIPRMSGRGSTSTRPIVLASSDDGASSSSEASSSQPRRSRDPSTSGSSRSPKCRTRMVWPRDYYAIDILDGFTHCDGARARRETIKDAFTAYFGANVKWNKSTYYEHRKRWDDAPQS